MGGMRATRVVVLGEFRADRLVPGLRRAGAEVVVLGFAELDGFLGPDVVCGGLPATLSEPVLLRLLDRHDADVAVPNPGCPGQEQFLPVYARVRSLLRGTGRRLHGHAEEFATLASDKVTLHRTAERRGWPVPRGVVCARPEAVRAAARELGFPLLVKEARSEFHAGRHHVRDETRLGPVCGGMTYPVLVQRAVTGEEFAVELLSLPGRTVAWPVASLGRLDGDCAPGRRVRVAPAALPARARTELSAVLGDIVATYEPCGPWQMDLAVDDEGGLRVIELNGRLGGVSNMSRAATGLDPHAAYAGTVLGGGLPRHPEAHRVALELPVRPGAVLPPAPPGTELTPYPGNPGNPGPAHGGVQRAVLGVPAGLPTEPVGDWLRALPPGVPLNSPDEAVTQLIRGVRALQAVRRAGS
ncbi:ATP-grasp domain-containing protein [Streptomyces abikoensis]|uniref:ATP-grasp domain-containing protein n=1 Tax=Streptomyces abikoensis TaxID=97398 RepID=UPI001671C835|nr:ATP-grasp domain-containing protein [Streptomyces abikoensis]